MGEKRIKAALKLLWEEMAARGWTIIFSTGTSITGGTLIWLCYPAIAGLFPNAVKTGDLAGDITWLHAVAVKLLSEIIFHQLLPFYFSKQGSRRDIDD